MEECPHASFVSLRNARTVPVAPLPEDFGILQAFSDRAGMITAGNTTAALQGNYTAVMGDILVAKCFCSHLLSVSLFFLASEILYAIINLMVAKVIVQCKW